MNITYLILYVTNNWDLTFVSWFYYAIIIIIIIINMVEFGEWLPRSGI
jgi:hypothetical protein